MLCANDLQFFLLVGIRCDESVLFCLVDLIIKRYANRLTCLDLDRKDLVQEIDRSPTRQFSCVGRNSSSNVAENIRSSWPAGRSGRHHHDRLDFLSGWNRTTRFLLKSECTQDLIVRDSLWASFHLTVNNRFKASNRTEHAAARLSQE